MVQKAFGKPIGSYISTCSPNCAAQLCQFSRNDSKSASRIKNMASISENSSRRSSEPDPPIIRPTMRSFWFAPAHRRSRNMARVGDSGMIWLPFYRFHEHALNAKIRFFLWHSFATDGWSNNVLPHSPAPGQAPGPHPSTTQPLAPTYREPLRRSPKNGAGRELPYPGQAPGPHSSTTQPPVPTERLAYHLLTLRS